MLEALLIYLATLQIFPQEIMEWRFSVSARYDFEYVHDIGEVTRYIGDILAIYALGNKN